MEGLTDAHRRNQPPNGSNQNSRANDRGEYWKAVYLEAAETYIRLECIPPFSAKASSVKEFAAFLAQRAARVEARTSRQG